MQATAGAEEAEVAEVAEATGAGAPAAVDAVLADAGADAVADAVAETPRAVVALVLQLIPVAEIGPAVEGLVAVSARLLRMVRAAKSLMLVRWQAVKSESSKKRRSCWA